MMRSVKVYPMYPTKINCKCCGKDIVIGENWSSEDIPFLCDDCYVKHVREFFNPENENLTVKQFREKMRNDNQN